MAHIPTVYAYNIMFYEYILYMKSGPIAAHVLTVRPVRPKHFIIISNKYRVFNFNLFVTFDN